MNEIPMMLCDSKEDPRVASELHQSILMNEVRMGGEKALNAWGRREGTQMLLLTRPSLAVPVRAMLSGVDTMGLFTSIN